MRAIQGRPGYAVLALDAEQALEFAAHQVLTMDPVEAHSDVTVEVTVAF